MPCRNVISLFLFLFFFTSFPPEFRCSKTSEQWIKVGYWYSGGELPVTDINAALFTHLVCTYAHIDSFTYQISINSSSLQSCSSFTNTVKNKNPKIKTLLTILVGLRQGYSSVFSSMLNQSSHRASFILSSIETARLYGFDGLDLFWVEPSSISNMTSFESLLQEWRDAVASESRNSRKPELLLVLTSHDSPIQGSTVYPMQSIEKNLDWVHLAAYDYHVPMIDNFTALHSALHNEKGKASVDSGVNEWLSRGLSANKLALGLPYHGYAWKLENPKDNHVGAKSSGPAITADGSIGYKAIESFIRDYGYGAAPVYNSTYGVSLFTSGDSWINFDGPEAIKTKVSYAKEKGLLGFCVFQLSNDNNWELSRAAQLDHDDGKEKKKKLLIAIIIPVFVLLLMVVAACFLHRRVVVSSAKSPYKSSNELFSAENLGDEAQDLQVFSFSTIKAATKNFSSKNKLGEGGFGPVYKGKLRTEQEIAVKRLSRNSHQGHEEFKNEVTLTSRLQHVNLLRVLGVCTERGEKMLVYENMPNKSLDFYLFDPVRRCLLDWEKRVDIIEGVIQGILYLQEYSNFTIIHRDIKASNILLDGNMKPKISDFGTAKLFRKTEVEAKTDRIIGTYGFVPPEYVNKGVYSMKYDVYSFGVLLLQILSGKSAGNLYGHGENLSLLQYAYELWKEGAGKEFFDTSLDDSSSAFKLMACMQVALLCVQEDPIDRPSMLDVYTMLRNEAAAMPIPKQPAFAIQQGGNGDSKTCTTKDSMFSDNSATITQLLPR